MTNSVKMVLICVVLAVVGTTAFGQSAPPASSVYDADLANKLGADEYGMRNYVFVILKTGPKDADYKGKERDDIFRGHLTNVQRLAGEGKLVLAGPFGKNDKALRGLFIFNVATIDEAQKLLDTDPAVKAGIFIGDLIPWYGSASLMAIQDIHKKIMKRSL